LESRIYIPVFWGGSTHSLLQHSGLQPSSTASGVSGHNHPMCIRARAVSFTSADLDYLTQTGHTGTPEVYKGPGVTRIPQSKTHLNCSTLSTNLLSQWIVFPTSLGLTTSYGSRDYTQTSTTVWTLAPRSLLVMRANVVRTLDTQPLSTH
jgi:hypothetical protein